MTINLDLQNTQLIFTLYVNFIIFTFILINNNGQQSVWGYWNILCDHYIKQLYKTII